MKNDIYDLRLVSEAKAEPVSVSFPQKAPSVVRK